MKFKTDPTSSRLSANPSRVEKRRPCTTERKRSLCIKYNYLQEMADTPECKEEDFKIIKELLEVIEVTSESESVTCIGR